MPLRRALAAACLMAALSLPGTAPADSPSREGYYYPPVGSSEVFDRSLFIGPYASPEAREAFVTMVTRAQLEAPSNPVFSLMAKGEGSRHLIMVGLDDASFRTLYRARGVLSQLTYNLRATSLFQEQGLAATGTFFDLLQLLEFSTLVVTDGESWSHRIDFE